MKTQFKSLSAVLLLLLAASCKDVQKLNVPESVLTSFHSKFGAAKDVEWQKESDNEWEAGFEMEGKEMTASFNGSGEWMETEYSVSRLPELVAAKIADEFGAYKIEETEYVETSTFRGYEIALEKGEEEREIRINESGEIVDGENDDDEGDDNEGRSDDEENEGG
ncbi:MAG: PepSY-like domain-containing protein [Flammeovirgaceae bacterium]|nr:PepSY-like domain-containing protein [Flammeovirgaceae bacterium]